MSCGCPEAQLGSKGDVSSCDSQALTVMTSIETLSRFRCGCTVTSTMRSLDTGTLFPVSRTYWGMRNLSQTHQRLLDVAFAATLAEVGA